jgi:CBS-domain-containing membrane protein
MKRSPFSFKAFFAAHGVVPQRVAAVDHDVARLEAMAQAVNHGLGALARLDEDDDLAGLERLDKLLQLFVPTRPPGVLGSFRRRTAAIVFDHKREVGCG